MAGKRHRAPLRRVGLDAAADDGRDASSATTLPDRPRALRAAARPRRRSRAPLALAPGGPESREVVVGARLRAGRPGSRATRSSPAAATGPRARSSSTRRRARRRGGQGGAGRDLDAPSPSIPPGAEPLARAARRPLQAVGRVDGRGLDALPARAVRLRAQDASTTRPSARATSPPPSTRSCCPTSPKEVIATGQPRREDGDMRYFAELPAGVRGRPREGGRGRAQGLRRRRAARSSRSPRPPTT